MTQSICIPTQKEKNLDNVRRNPRVGFEVDRELEFLPSYFEDPKDASLADTSIH